jgi:ATP-dependent Clp protease adaptor protein ClpS
MKAEHEAMAQKFSPHFESDTATETRTEKKLKKPPLYKVLLHNDNYTTREFVVAVLKEVFHKTESDAVQIMLHVHYNGTGVAGIYTFEVAETKVQTVEKLARENEFPLRVSMEPEET